MTLKQLSDLDLEAQHKARPNFPKEYLVRTKFSDTTANGLTKAVVTFLNLSGHQAERISTTGRYIDNSKIVTDVTGAQRVIGKGKWIKGSGVSGSADISSTINVKGIGLSVKWEIKIKDRQSEAQKLYQLNIEKSGGQYYIVHNFEEFIFYYNKVLLSLGRNPE